MPLNRADIRRQLEPGLNTVFGLAYKRYPEEWRYFLDVETETQRAYVEDVMMTGFGIAPVKGEGAPVQYDAASESYIARYYFETIALAFAITEEAEEDALYGDIGAQLSKALAISAPFDRASTQIGRYGFEQARDCSRIQRDVA